jgi:transcriptional regulator with XRE-family HTH domain
VGVARGGRAVAEAGLFGAELAAARKAAGLSQEALGALVHFSAGLIGMVETGRRIPSVDLARALDEAFRTPGTYERLQQHARAVPLPSWFRPWAEIEAGAAELRLFELSVVPGLFQTEAYARSLLSCRPGLPPGELDALVAARISRQSVFTREGGPPLVWALIDESTLNRRIGGAKIMHEQLLHLADLIDQPHVSVQILPLSAGAHYGLAGAFAIAERDGGTETAYLDTVTDGFIAENASVVGWIAQTFDTLRSEALPASASQDLIRKRAEDFGSEQR